MYNKYSQGYTSIQQHFPQYTHVAILQYLICSPIFQLYRATGLFVLPIIYVISSSYVLTSFVYEFVCVGIIHFAVKL